MFVGLNATSFILSAGVSEGVAALAAIQGKTGCGSKTFTVDNASTCMGFCTTGAPLNNCMKAAAYGFVTVHSALLSATNPLVLTNITAMNTTVNAIVPAISVADSQLRAALSSLSTGFSRFNQCGWIGTSFINIRTSLCGNVADTINVLWICCGVLGFVLMYLPIVIIKAEKRFKRPKSIVTVDRFLKKKQPPPPLNSSYRPDASHAGASPPPPPASASHADPRAASAPPASLTSHDISVSIPPSM